MLLTLSGIVILVKSVQEQNALSPMLVTLSGIVMFVKPLQSRKASLPMVVTLPSLGITLFLQPTINSFEKVLIMQLFWL